MIKNDSKINCRVNQISVILNGVKNRNMLQGHAVTPSAWVDSSLEDSFRMTCLLKYFCTAGHNRNQRHQRAINAYYHRKITEKSTIMLQALREFLHSPHRRRVLL